MKQSTAKKRRFCIRPFAHGPLWRLIDRLGPDAACHSREQAVQEAKRRLKEAK